MRGIDRPLGPLTGQTPSEKRGRIGCTVYPLGSRVRGNDDTFCKGPTEGRGDRPTGGCGFVQSPPGAAETTSQKRRKGFRRLPPRSGRRIYFSVMLFRKVTLSVERDRRSIMRSAASVGLPLPFDDCCCNSANMRLKSQTWRRVS